MPLAFRGIDKLGSAPKPKTDSFAGGVAQGLGDALTLGDQKMPEVDMISAQGAGQMAGLILGEIPFYMVGGTIAKQAVQRSVQVAKLAKKAPRIFGAAIESSTAFGIDVGRSAAGEDDVFTPARVIANVALPFAMAGMKKKVKPAKAFDTMKFKHIPGTGPSARGRAAARENIDRINARSETPKPFEPTRQSDIEHAFRTAPQVDDAIPHTFPSRTRAEHKADVEHAFSSPRTREEHGADLQHVFGLGNEDDAAAFVANQSLWGYKSGSNEHINGLMQLYDKGVPYAHLRGLTHPDDVADYILLMPKLFDEGALAKKAASRVGANRAFIRDSLTAQFRDAPGGASLLGNIPFDDAGAVVRPGGKGELATSARHVQLGQAGALSPRDPALSGAAGQTATPFSEVPLGNLDDAAPIPKGQLHALDAARKPPTAGGAEDRIIETAAEAIPQARTYSPVHGSSGTGPSGAADQVNFDLVNDPPMLDVPVNAFGDHVRVYTDAVAAAPIVNRAVVSSLRALEAMGPAGRQASHLMRQARRWVHSRTGEAHGDMLNAFAGMKTPEQYRAFVMGVDIGKETSDPAVKAAVDAFRTHQKYLENTFVGQGVQITMADGSTKPLVDVAEKFFFPHKHDWDALMKDPVALKAAAEKINNLLSDAVPDVPPKKLVEWYIRNMDNTRIPRFSALHERNVNMPGWQGDPSTMAARGEKGYKADVQDAVMDFLEDAYGMAGNNRYLGAPKGLSLQDDMNMWTDLEPVHRTIKKILDSSRAALKGNPGGGTPTLRARAAFKDVKAVGRQAAADIANDVDDSVAGEIVREVENSIGLRMAGREAPWKLQPMLSDISVQGGDVDVALQIIQHVQGAKGYHRGRQKASRWVRDMNIVTKLGVMVAENMGQISFSVTKMGFKNTSKALMDLINPKTKAATIEEVTRWGVLLEDAMKGLESDAGRNFAGKFLEKVGFRASEKFLRTTAAVAGKYHVTDLFKTLGKGVGKGGQQGRNFNTAVRQLEKYGFHMSKVVDRKSRALTDDGWKMVNAMADGGDESLAGAIKQLAGFEGARGTQFMADVMDNPIAWQSPEAKILTQFKTFVTSATKFAMREIVEEAVQGNARPLARMLMTGIVIGELTQDAKDFVSGVDPRERGQGGFIREKLGTMFGIRELPDDDEAMFTVLGQKMSGNDVAARMLENLFMVGYAGIFFSMAQAAIQGGKMRAYGFIAGPTVEGAFDVAAGVSEAVQGDASRLGRRALREGTSALGGHIPGFGGAFAGAAVGRNAQLAALPTERQLERSLYVTPDEQKEVAQRQVVRRYNDVRAAAKAEVLAGNHEEAARLVSVWNSRLESELGQLINLGALNHSSMQRLSFDNNDLRRLMLSTEDVEPSTGERVQGAFENVQGIASQPLLQGQ